mmetsp:Transcript_26408/g.76220  ORF Transcript_26408/g.76220 Transcript_26408/m.76220 type:complete len:200 (-) Transcript_26408:677-1276(-)
MQTAMTPLTMTSSLLRFLRILSINIFTPGMLPAMASMVPCTPRRLEPCDRSSDWTSAAWPSTASAAFIELPIALRSRNRCSIPSSLPPPFPPPIPPPPVLAPRNSSACSRFRATAALVFLKSAEQSKRISRYRFTSNVCWLLPVRSAQGIIRRSMRSVMDEMVRLMSAAKVASSSLRASVLAWLVLEEAEWRAIPASAA